LGDIVITSIQPPTPSILAMLAKACSFGLGIIVIGDRKTPSVNWSNGIEFVSLQNQLEFGYALASELPENHYARKNIGYLLAMSRRSPLIYDTDDDNAPLQNWRVRTLLTSARACLESGWVNPYRWFGGHHIWPRGLPLTHAHRDADRARLGAVLDTAAPIQQGLANGSPDVDAVWRLLMDRDIVFSDGVSVRLPPGAWCPFNSQSTWWFPEAYSLLYLPSHVSFRMTDIWRSFIAQRCLWEMGHGVVFHGPEVLQERNPHNLQRDFEQEVPGYLCNDRIRDILERTPLLPGAHEISGNLHRCYVTLVGAGIVPTTEMKLVECWLRDLENMDFPEDAV
jgi:hypothetical protein